MISSTSFRRVRALCLFLGLVAVAFAVPVNFDIPAQSGNTALQLFGRQAAVEVLFPAAEIKKIQTAEVKGEMEPSVALERLLAGTGFSAEQTGPKNFIVKKTPVTTGAVKGMLMGEGGRSMGGVLVAVRDTALSTETDRYGQYVFPKMAAGTYVLVANAPGFQPLHITDVQVRAGRELTLGKEEMRKAKEGPLALEPFVVHADTVTELDPYEVTGAKVKPFEGSNMDIPRTINDAQPYYIFDHETIDRSGAANVEDFLRQQLTMNGTAITNSQRSGINQLGNTSSINLRGLGGDKTLVLVNGRRRAGVRLGSVDSQTDLNGIPVSAIERIEVLPSSASGIYGGSAIGGVVNVILKKNYVGREVRLSYDNTLDTDSHRSTLAANIGLGFNGGKTHLMVSFQASEAGALLLQDRAEILARGIATISANNPAFLYSSTTPFLGALPNITARTGTATALPLKNGGSISSRNTFVPAGTSSTTSPASLVAGLIANAGQWSFDLPASTQAPTGLLRPLGVTPKTSSLSASFEHQLTTRLKVFAEVAESKNRSASVYNPVTSTFVLPTSAPTSPFAVDVNVQVPLALDLPMATDSTTRSATIGLVAELPAGWTIEIDYTWSGNRHTYLYTGTDTAALNAAVNSGVLNILVDTLLYAPQIAPYLAQLTYAGESFLDDYSARASGSLWSLPTGTPTLTVGVQHRVAKVPENVNVVDNPVTVASSTINTIFKNQQSTTSWYAETVLPVVKKNALPLLHALDLQVSGRGERYSVNAGTTGSRNFFERTPPVVTYLGPTQGGLPFSARAKYDSNHLTVGLKYQPVPSVTLRASHASAFLPPTPAQLVPSPEISPRGALITSDPRNPSQGFAFIPAATGGNPNLRPQNSKSLNVGAIWEPRGSRFEGLRANVEYYRIRQFDYIANLDGQGVLNQEALWPERVTRNAAGQVIQIDMTAMNLYKRETEGWDFGIRYARPAGRVRWLLDLRHTMIAHLKDQYALSLPEYDSAGYPVEGGAVRHRSVGSLSWQLESVSFGWTSRRTGNYRQLGAPGGPASMQFAQGGVSGSTVAAQGSATIPAQIYHDVFVDIDLGKTFSGGARWLTVLTRDLRIQAGVRNLFDTLPPVDVGWATNSYASPYGDSRLRSYWINVRKQF